MDNAPRKKSSALERARADLAADRPDRARDRLTGYLYTLHCRGEYSQEAYLLLGDAYFAMKEYARAAAAWLLTEKQGPEFDTALQAFHQRHGKDPANILSLLKPHAPSEDYPPRVRERLKEWDYRYRTYRPRSNPHTSGEPTSAQPRGVRPVELGCGAVLLIGTLLLAYWLFRLVAGR